MFGALQRQLQEMLETVSKLCRIVGGSELVINPVTACSDIEATRKEYFEQYPRTQGCQDEAGELDLAKGCVPPNHRHEDEDGEYNQGNHEDVPPESLKVK